MIKWSTFAPRASNGFPLISIIHESLEKTAEYRQELSEFLGAFEKKANHTYVLVNAMTSGEYFGPNLNGDFFPDKQLETYHKSFEKHAFAYRHHKNKDPKASAGKVVYASHNPEMHRVELVIELENEKAQDIIDRINKGEFPAVSMGTRTPSDRCSVCNNRAKNTASYCDHLKYQMRHTLPDGRRVYAVNDDRLTFFDISFVRIPADKTASVITKVASAEDEVTVPSAVIGEEWMKRAGIKESTLFKDVPGTIEGMSPDPKRLVYDTAAKIPKETLDKIASSYPLNEILSTFLNLRVMPKPEEFVRLVLLSSKKEPLLELAERALGHERQLIDLTEEGTRPIEAEFSYKGFNNEIAEHMAPHLEHTALTRPLIIRRILIKQAGVQLPTNLHDSYIAGKTYTQVPQGPSNAPNDPTVPTNLKERPGSSLLNPTKNPLLPLAGLGLLYKSYLKWFNHKPTEFSTFIKSNPWALPILIGSAALGTSAAQSLLQKQSSVLKAIKENAFAKAMVAVPASYVYAGHQENKIQKGEPISKLQDQVRRHPFVTGLLGAIGIQGAQEYGPQMKKWLMTKKGSFDRLLNLDEDKFNELYNDIIENVETLDIN